MIELIIEFTLVGLVGGLLGIFYRNCLKIEDMVFYWWYKILKKWIKNSNDYCTYFGCFKATKWNKFLGWLAYPLGFCIYCSTTWITFFLCALWLFNWESLPDWNLIVIGVLAAIGVQHLIVACACRFLIFKHPDLDV